MDIRELEDFKLSDAVKFHEKLNPALWADDKLRPEVKDQLIKIADDFLAELGISGLKVKDITVSGSNAAYTYTPHSDLDLHILVDFNELPDDQVYQELFTAKKSLYNDSHEIKVHGVPVELYVQDSNKPVVSIGEYSLKSNDWLKFPSKRKANFNQSATRAKYEKLGSMIELALQSDDIDQIDKVTKIIKQYRQAGLDKHGEFGSENLAFKALRNMGMIKKLYNHKNKIHSKKLSIESAMDEDWHPNDVPPGPEFPPTMPSGTIRVDVSDVYDWYKLGQHISNMKGLGKHDFGKGPPSTILSFGDEDLEHKYIDALKKTGLDTTDIDPKAHDTKKGQKVDPTYNVNEILDTKSKAPFYNMGSDIDKQVPFKTKSGRRYGLDFINAMDAHSRPRLRQFPKIKPKLLRYKDEIVDNGVEVVFGQDDFMLDNPTGITGTGSAAEVFGIVTNKIIEYIKKFNPPYLYFTSFDDEPSRVRLYNSLLRRVMPTLPGYFYKVIKIENSYQFVIFDQDFFVGETINEVSGYIPSEKEKNDPRFKTALTVDVKPDSIKKNAKAFGWKVSREGKPPLLRK